MSYHNLQIQVRADSPLFQWCDDVTKATNNLYNAAMFVERQLRSGLNKEPAARFENEIEVHCRQLKVAMVKLSNRDIK